MAGDILVVPINVSTDLYIESIDSPSVVSNNTRVFYARKATDTEYGVVKLTDITAVIGGSRVLNMTGAEILAAVSDDTIIVGSVAYCNLDGDIYEQSKLYKLNSDREWIEIDSKYVSEALDAHDIDVTAHDNLFTLKLDKKPDGSVNLIGTDYKIDEKYLPPFAVSGGLVFGGTFGADGLIVATSRIPELNGTLIDNITLATYPSVYFKATASYAFGGKSYDAGDIAICNGDITPNWTKIDGSDAVTGVKGNNEVAYRLGNVNITKDNIGLGEVDNTSDEDKPISTAVQGELDTINGVLNLTATKSYVDEELVKKANLDGATFTGNITIGSTETPKNLEVKGTTTVTAPTADLHAATKKYVDDAVVGAEISPNGIDYLKDPDKTYLVIKTPEDNDTFELLTGDSGSPDYTIDWGDGISENITTTANPTHEYEKQGMYLITISGAFENGIVNGWLANVNKNKIIEVYGGSNYPLSIESNAFRNCTSLTTANFPNVTSIESNAFTACTSLTAANFPNVTSIVLGAFFGCSSLTTANFPNATSIESDAFTGCSSLTTANFPNVTSISNFAFQNCTSLKELTIGNVTTTSTGTRFQNVKLTSLTIAQDVTGTDINRITTFFKANGGMFIGNETKNGLRVEKTPTADNDVVRKIDLDNKADKSTTLAGYGITDAYTKTEIESKIASVYKYKGNVANYASLPIDNLTVGDVYNVEDTGDNYAWTGSEWDKLAGTVDLSGYATKLSIGQWHVPYRDEAGAGEANTSKLATMTSPLPSAILIRDTEGKATFVGGTSASQGIVKSQLDSAVANMVTTNTEQTISGVKTFSNNIKGTLNGNANSSTYCSRLKGVDTRDTNETPEWYYTGQSVNTRTFLSEFKTTSVLGLSGSDYCLLLTCVPWGDATGGLPSQTAYLSDGKKYARYATSTTTWSDWKKEVTTEDIDNLIGDIDSILDNINGEVV